MQSGMRVKVSVQNMHVNKHGNSVVLLTDATHSYVAPCVHDALRHALPMSEFLPGSTSKICLAQLVTVESLRMSLLSRLASLSRRSLGGSAQAASQVRSDSLRVSSGQLGLMGTSC